MFSSQNWRMMTAYRGAFVAALALTLGAFAGSPTAHAKPAVTRPNIILITSDDQRVDELASMTAVQRELVQKGTTFTRAYAPFPLCCPARASIMSGQYAHNHGVIWNAVWYSAFNDGNALAPWLQSAGYQTALVGKYLLWWSVAKPIRIPPGWTEWQGLAGGLDYFNTRIVESYGGAPPVIRDYNGVYQTDVFASLAEDIIRRRIGSQAPLFLWVSFTAPHVGPPTEPDDPPNIDTPAVAPRHRNAFAGTTLKIDASFNEADVSDKPAYVRNRPSLTTQTIGELKELAQQRLESLRAVDEAVYRIVLALRASGELNNTIIVYASDNGYMLGEHRIPDGKIVPYDPSARIPLIIRGPGFPANVQRSQPVALIDLAPTFVQAGRAVARLATDGMSLLPLAADPRIGADRTLVVEAGPSGTTAGAPWFYRGVRSSKWLYLEYEQSGEVEMYDLALDPYQLRNVSSDNAYLVDRLILAAQFARLRNCAGPTCQ